MLYVAEIQHKLTLSTGKNTLSHKIDSCGCCRQYNQIAVLLPFGDVYLRVSVQNVPAYKMDKENVNPSSQQPILYLAGSLQKCRFHCLLTVGNRQQPSVQVQQKIKLKSIFSVYKNVSQSKVRERRITIIYFKFCGSFGAWNDCQVCWKLKNFASYLNSRNGRIIITYFSRKDPGLNFLQDILIDRNLLRNTKWPVMNLKIRNISIDSLGDFPLEKPHLMLRNTYVNA